MRSEHAHEHGHSFGESEDVVAFATEWYMGVALVLGFAVMFLIDQFGPSHHPRRVAGSGLEPDQPAKNFKAAFLGKNPSSSFSFLFSFVTSLSSLSDFLL